VLLIAALGFFSPFFVLFFIQRRVLLVAALGALLQILKRVSNIVSLTTLTALTRLVPCTNLNLVPCTNLNSVTGPLLITSLLLLISGIPTLEKLVPITKRKSLLYWPLWVFLKTKRPRAAKTYTPEIVTYCVCVNESERYLITFKMIK
jgi:hypothetical protein